MVKIAETVLRFGPHACSLPDAAKIVVCFLAIGVASGLFIGFYI